ncbi:phosphoribosyl transferase [Candidatus Uhrbacteria bacterium RIFCSPHIGHO2_01_FULL_63_20]|uniref:Phosphoribosyl transferase n=1 Tax=Candidatus Uhrbacteria bacterium RIFCSPHIGHO2_01_FULL_63_20 TaxID=1802385 RepID=A0A1F7TKV8_9BACT|nr:MAG: phosphoribosyl transferase [Candidatus Uhrbacteria bacterium RIFCSPHIGHO2_01_FULL_63_20]
MMFEDRADAARQLVEKLRPYAGKDVVVYALPRGGVVLGVAVAKALKAPLDLLIPRKIGHPDNPEYAIASVTERGAVVRQEDEVRSVDPKWFDEEVRRQREEARRRRERYLSGRPAVPAKGKAAIVVDDGIATGLTMKAALSELRTREPSSVVVAVPVAARDALRELGKEVDEVVVLHEPAMFLGSIGNYYEAFDQVSDEEVVAMMKRV